MQASDVIGRLSPIIQVRTSDVGRDRARRRSDVVDGTGVRRVALRAAAHSFEGVTPGPREHSRAIDPGLCAT